MLETEAWKPDGLCSQLSQTDPDLWKRFFADTALERRPARNLCERCPVKDICLRTALEQKEIWGVWGGCDESEIRRALWVNALGVPTVRCRFPHCPSCKARPSQLFIVSHCEMGTGRKREQVECAACGFYWRSPSSVVAVKAYWREYFKLRRVRARAPQGRIPSGRPRRSVVAIYPREPSEAVPTALVASVKPAS
jgi:WhiB family redox-sensing transcriptional regulator